MDVIDQIARQVVAEPEVSATSLDIDRLLAWRDGRLTEAEAADVERQLAHDPVARAFLAESTADAPAFLTRWAQAQAQRPSRRRWWIAGVGLAAAAVLAVFLWRPAVTPAPDYAIAAVRGGHADTRSDAVQAGPIEVDEQSVLTIALKPNGARTTVPQARVVVVHGGTTRRVEAQAEMGDGGAMRLTLPAGTFPKPGAYTVRIAIAEQLDAVPAPEAPGVQWLDFTVRRVR